MESVKECTPSNAHHQMHVYSPSVFNMPILECARLLSAEKNRGLWVSDPLSVYFSEETDEVERDNANINGYRRYLQ